MAPQLLCLMALVNADCHAGAVGGSADGSSGYGRRSTGASAAAPQPTAGTAGPRRQLLDDLPAPDFDSGLIGCAAFLKLSYDAPGRSNQDQPHVKPDPRWVSSTPCG